MHEIEQSGEFLGRILGPLLKSDWLLMENLLTSLAKSLLIPSGLKLAASAADAAFEKKIFGSIMKILDLVFSGQLYQNTTRRILLLETYIPLRNLVQTSNRKLQ